MIQHGILALASNSQVISKYYAHNTENGHDEALLLSELETLTDGQVNLKNLMTIGVTNHFGSTQANIDYFGQLYDDMKDNLLIYAPLSDVYSQSSIGAAFYTESSTSMNRIDRV